MHDIQPNFNEELIWIDLPGTNGLKLKAIIQGNLNQPVAVILHGRPGFPVGYSQSITGQYLNKRGITLIRPFMYNNDPATRQLEDTNLDTYTADFDTIVSYLKQHKVPKIFGIGHSYGGMAMLNSKSKLDAGVLWDPVHGLFWTDLNAHKNSNKPLAEFEAFGDTTSLAKGKGYPLKLISAGKGKMVKYNQRYYEAADEPKAYVVIEGAQHNLSNSPKILDEVRSETADWLTRYI